MIETNNFFKDIPKFMPDATFGSVKSLTWDKLEHLGYKSVVINTIHTIINIGIENIEKAGGLKQFTGWSGNILTDSGGFQIFSLLRKKKMVGKINDDGAIFKSPKNGNTINLTPELSIEYQLRAGTDVVTLLDDCIGPELDYKQTEIAVKRTLKWAERGFNYIEKNNIREKCYINGVVQGGQFTDLREKCFAELDQYKPDIIAFGGYTMQNGAFVYEQLEHFAKITKNYKYKYAMGVGTPENIKNIYSMGYRIFDSVLPTRNARHGLLYNFDNKEISEIRIKRKEFANDFNPISEDCKCTACKLHSRSYLRQMLMNGELSTLALLTEHNLATYSKLLSFLSNS